jgi:hypothetical protein
VQRLWRGRFNTVGVSSMGNMDSRLAPPAGSGPEAVRVTGASAGVSVTHFGAELFVFGVTVGGCLNLSVTCPRQLIGRDKGEWFMRHLAMYLTDPPSQLPADREVCKLKAVVGEGQAFAQ